MKWVGLTGGIASGKSTVTRMLRQKSYTVIDADEIAHEVVKKGAPGLKSVVQVFGSEILQHDGSLDRRKLGQLVFGVPENLVKLEAILHPMIRVHLHNLKSELMLSGLKLAFYDVPLLFEKNLEADFDAIVVVTCTEAQQRARLKARSQLSDRDIDRRLLAQIPLMHKIKKAHFVIHNDQDEIHLQSEVEKMVQFVENLP